MIRSPGILVVDEKWSVTYDKDSNDSPMVWNRHGEEHSDFSENNAVLAMFYALLEARANAEKLAAWQCPFTDGQTGLVCDEGGGQFCAMQKKLKGLEDDYAELKEEYTSEFALRTHKSSQVRILTAQVTELTKSNKAVEARESALLGPFTDGQTLIRHNAAHAAQVADLTAKLKWAHDNLWEINPNNYDHDDVCKLNDASVNVILEIAPMIGETHGKSSEWWDARAALKAGGA